MNSRRSFFQFTISSLIAFSGSSLFGCATTKQQTPLSKSHLQQIGALLPADKNGIMLPAGFTSRIIATSGSAPFTGSLYKWHGAPDGGATFATDNGGWIYVSNSELGNQAGGVGAIAFNASGEIIQAYSILDNSNRNCAGGATPWKTWLSCEEVSRGYIWECDPFGQLAPVQKPALGRFAHEAVTVDTQNLMLYMTEDRSDGGFYRFIPASFNANGYPDLETGRLEVAVVDPKNARIEWLRVSDPAATSQATRYQVASSTAFNGGEGIVYVDEKVSFATKGDNRIWSYDTRTQQLWVIYDSHTHNNPILTGVDNITLSQDGELVISEDGGNLQIIMMTEDSKLIPLMQLTGQDASEIAGPAFSPDGQRLYFSSQRGISGLSADGITYEIRGPFHL